MHCPLHANLESVVAYEVADHVAPAKTIVVSFQACDFFDTLPFITKEDFSPSCPCTLFPAFFHLIVLWSHLCAHGNRSGCGFFHPLSTRPAISCPCSVSTGMTGHELKTTGCQKAADCTYCT